VRKDEQSAVTSHGLTETDGREREDHDDLMREGERVQTPRPRVPDRTHQRGVCTRMKTCHPRRAVCGGGRDEKER
jgi:hypothetical protein